MSPWWLRPTAEGAPDEPAGDGAATPEEPAEASPPAEERSAAERKGGAGGAKRERDGAKADRPERSRGSGSAPAREGGERRRGRAGGRGEGAAAKPAGRDREAPPPRRGADERAATRDGDADPRRRSGAEPRKGEQRPREEFTFEDDISAVDFAALRGEILAAPERTSSVSDERKIAMFCDLENLALGVRDSEIKKFDIALILERLLEKGRIIVKKAYCDWERYSDYKRAFHEAAIEMIDIPQKYYSGKNSADIKMVVDAMELSYANEHLDTFVLLSGDSDFSPLVSKLKENNKYVIGIGVKDSSSALLVDNCDEFIYYEDVWRDRQRSPKVDGSDKKKSEAFRLMVDAIQALLRDNKDVLWGSMIKQTMQRKKPSFNEGYFGYSTFSELLEDAERNNLIKLKKDQRSGTYIVTGFSGRSGR